ncbi:MAG: fumarylacetoacetate hydrolase family protein [Chloroflexi bacterium]|nr:fumarylacetoacetate hydrolase family protein [Chloroflexota bacterium]
MILLTFEQDGTYQLGVKTDKGVIDVTGIEPTLTPDAFFSQGSTMLSRLHEILAEADESMTHAEDSLKIGPPVPNPGKILCVGLNYQPHAAESNMEAPEYPVLFSKFNNAIAATGEDVPIASDWKAVDYEAEMVVVIGKTAHRVSEADALGCVLGYCNGSDFSERDLQFRSGQWLLGKTADNFLPIGPYLVTTDEIPDPQNLPIRGWYNGELRQESNTANMIFAVATIIAYASQYMTLNPGDIISTGTPEGVIIGRPEKDYMRPGDEYIVEVGPLGRLTNKLVEM